MTHAEAAVALTTAHLAGLPDEVLDEILAEVDSATVAKFLAAVCAGLVDGTAGGEEWLQRFALAAAGGAP